MLGDVRACPGCSGMFEDVRECSGMFGDVWGCSGILIVRDTVVTKGMDTNKTLDKLLTDLFNLNCLWTSVSLK